MILNFTPQQALGASLRPLLSLGKLLGLVFFLSLPLLLLSSAQSYAQRPFITVWKTDNPGTSGDNQITIPGFGSNYTIGWQKVDNLDITGSEIGSNTHTITFPSSGVYRVYIFSPFHRIAFGGFGDKEKILDVEQWGDIEWTTFSLGFSGCSNLSISAIDAPNLSRVTELSSIFLDAENMNSNINHWDVSNVTSLNSIFSGAISFNQPLDNWDVSNVVFMSSMFSGATSFNQDIGKWNTTKVKEFSGMFSNAISFDQDISNWDVSNAEKMQYMFSETPLFNQDISRWNVSKVKLMTGMFAVANSFNQDISNWDVSNVTDMSAMFFEAPLFNQDISKWNTSKVLAFISMFKGANTFNQNLGTWEIRSLRFAGNMLDDCGLSAANYSSTLDGWFANETTPESIFLGAENMAYCTTFGREGLITTKNWTIFGDSPCELVINSFSPKNEFYLAEDAQTSIYVIFDQPVQESDNFEDISITLEGSPALNLESASFSGDTLYIYQGPLSLGTYEITVPENAIKSLVLQGIEGLSWTFVNLGPLSADNKTLATTIYPNPFSQQITFSFEMPESGDVSLVLRDMAGREVYTSALPNAHQGRQELKVDRGNIPQGVYLYEIRSGQYQMTGRIIAQ